MTKVQKALQDVRDRLLLAMAALTDGDEDKAAEELTEAATELRSVIEELRAA